MPHLSNRGTGELKNWIVSDTELPKIKHSFLIQLAWSDMLSVEELHTLCDEYERMLRIHLTVLRSPEQATYTAMGRTDRERFIWEMILKNGIRFYEAELEWIRELKEGL